MLMRSRALRTYGALSILMVAAACGDQLTTKPAARNFAPTISRDATPVAGQHVFALNRSIPTDFASRVAAAGGTVVRTIPSINVVVTQGLTDASASTLASSNEVAQDVQTQWIPAADSLQMSTLSVDTPADATSLLPPESAVFLSMQWNMFQIHAPEAWATKHTGIPSVRVAILDSGLDPDHIDQRGLIDWASSVAFVPSTNGPPTWADDNFHGTHVGGIVTSNNIGTAGVAPNVTLIAVKVLDAAGQGSFANIIAGIIWATDVHAQVINMSIGADIPKDPHLGPLVAAFNRAINYAKSNGVVVVSAAGNDAEDLQHAHAFISLPCEAGVQLCVSATGPGDIPASYTNYGTNAINVAAPGGEVAPAPASFVLSLCSSHSTLPVLAACRSGAHYVYVAGTSQAAPHVAGLAALLDSQFGGQLNPSQLITLIQRHADDLGKPGADPYFGKGRINVFNTVNSTTP